MKRYGFQTNRKRHILKSEEWHKRGLHVADQVQLDRRSGFYFLEEGGWSGESCGVRSRERMFFFARRLAMARMINTTSSGAPKSNTSSRMPA
jgi:hypothetical protein